MAAHFLFRCTPGVTRSLGPKIPRSSAQSNLNFVPKKHFAVTTVKERNYGPIEPGMPSVTSHWKTERVVAVTLVPLIPAALVFPTAALDMGLSAFLMLHTHWGLHGVLMDYIHGDTLKMIFNPLVTLLGVLAFAGLILLNVNDIGFGAAVRKMYKEL